MIGGREPLRGRRPGDRRIRVERPHAPYFRYTGKGVLTAKPAAIEPHDGAGQGRAARQADPHRPAARDRGGDRRTPLQEEGAGHLQLGRHQLQRLRDRGDPEGPRGGRRRRAVHEHVRRRSAIAILLAVVSTSYRQIGFAYPSGGGAYAVAKDNLGTLPALIAAGALLVDYMLTVAVSISSAVEQITSARPGPAAAGR